MTKYSTPLLCQNVRRIEQTKHSCMFLGGGFLGLAFSIGSFLMHYYGISQNWLSLFYCYCLHLQFLLTKRYRPRRDTLQTTDSKRGLKNGHTGKVRPGNWNSNRWEPTPGPGTPKSKSGTRDTKIRTPDKTVIFYI